MYAGGGPRFCWGDVPEACCSVDTSAGLVAKLSTLDTCEERGLGVVLIASSRVISATLGGSSSDVAMCPGGAPANMTSPP